MVMRHFGGDRLRVRLTWDLIPVHSVSVMGGDGAAENAVDPGFGGS